LVFGLLVVAINIYERRAPALGVVIAAAIAAAAGAAVGVVSYAWDHHVWPRLKARLRTRAGIWPVIIALVVIAGLGLLVATAPPIPPDAKFYYYPPTLRDCGALVLLLGFWFIFGGQRQQRMPDGSGNARYLAFGVALLAVVALALWTSQKDLATSGSSLRQFFRALPANRDLLPGLHTLGLATVALLAVIGFFHVATGWKGPFLKRGLRGAGGDILWLVGAAGLWLWGAFVPKDFGWFDALDMPDARYTVNFGLQALYLFIIVESGVTIALLTMGGRIDFDSFGGGGPRRPVPRKLTCRR
jgi:hypothetical protein